MDERREDCLFCKIVAGDIPASTVYRDEHVVAIEDRNPQAPVHLLVLPRQHYRDAGALSDAGNAEVSAALLHAAARLGRERGGDRGYRLAINTGADGGQTVGHLHVHVLAGRAMDWPPG